MVTLPMRARAALLLACLSPVPAFATDPELVVLADPTPSSSLSSASGPVTLSYRVVEVFDGEPGAASVIARHESLDAETRARLLAGHRVVLVAQPDPEARGRWIAGPPLWATRDAIAAFRRWSAPSDVREPRPVSEVVSELGAESAPAPASPEPPRVVAEPAEPIAEAEPVNVLEPSAPPVDSLEPAEETVTDEFTWPAHETPAEAPREVAALSVPEIDGDRSDEADHEDAADRGDDPLPAPTTRILSEAPCPSGERPPLLFERVLQPGPGAPPDPTGRVLGPPLEARRDLKPAKDGG